MNYVFIFHAWFFRGEGVRGFFGGMCVVFLGGMRGWWGGMHGFSGIRSMSGRYASYWNAFLFLSNLLSFNSVCFIC